MFGKTLALMYGVVAYVAFLVAFLYAIGFVGDVGVPRAIDGQPSGPLGLSLAVDLVLLTIFAVQHSVMARPAFKRAWTRIVSPAVERSTFVLAASAALGLLYWQWRPLGGVIWNIETPALRVALHGLAACGWLTVLVTTFLIDHFELFGLKQVWMHFRGRRPAAASFVTPGPYQHVRHPLYLGFIVAFWSTPTMTATHLLFAVMTTAYILVAIQFEEHDLSRQHPEYAAYRRRVPMIVPGSGAVLGTAPSSRGPASVEPSR